MTLGCIWLYKLLDTLTLGLINWLPDFLMVISYIISWLLILVVVIIGCYFFSTIAAIIASPFYSLLAERAEQILDAKDGFAVIPDKDQSIFDSVKNIVKDIPRCFWREFKKLLYQIPRFLVCVLISVIPIINTVAPISWFLFSAWMAAVQYCDYAYDNHKIPFMVMRRDLRINPTGTLCLGAIIAFGITLPLINLFVPAFAVCAGTRYYHEIKRHFAAEKDI